MTGVATTSSMDIRNEVAALKRERTIEVAASLFYERGYENTSLDMIAERMNVTKPFIYAHFVSKAELLAEICARGIASALEAMDSVLNAGSGSSRSRLEEVCRRFATAVLTNQRYIAIFAREEKNLAPDDFRRISDLRRAFDHKLVGLLDEGVAAGEFKVADTRMAALAIGGMVSWAYVWYRDHGRFSIEEISHKLTDLMLGMVTAQDLRVQRSKQGPRKPTRPKARA